MTWGKVLSIGVRIASGLGGVLVAGSDTAAKAVHGDTASAFSVGGALLVMLGGLFHPEVVKATTRKRPDGDGPSTSGESGDGAGDIAGSDGGPDR